MSGISSAILLEYTYNKHMGNTETPEGASFQTTSWRQDHSRNTN